MWTLMGQQARNTRKSWQWRSRHHYNVYTHVGLHMGELMPYPGRNR